MRVLLDENLPHDLRHELPGHVVSTVKGRRWAGLKNGKLLNRMNDEIDAFLTMDQSIEFQQNIAKLSFGIIVIRARSNRMVDLRPLINDILKALSYVQPGTLRRVG